MATHIVPIMQTANVSSAPADNTVSQFTATNIASLESSPKLVRGTSVRISVPLDVRPTTTPARKLVRRDSLERREAFLKGKEGSRQRRRWENGESIIP